MLCFNLAEWLAAHPPFGVVLVETHIYYVNHKSVRSPSRMSVELFRVRQYPMQNFAAQLEVEAIQ